MAYGNKIAIILKNDLEDWQKLNITSFPAGAVAIKFLHTHGKPLINASGSDTVISADKNLSLQKSRMEDVHSMYKNRCHLS